MTSRWTWPRVGPLPALAFLLALSTEGVVKGLLAPGSPDASRGTVIFLNWLGWAGAWPALPIALAVVRNAPLPRDGALRFTLLHGGGFVASALACTLVPFSARHVLFAAGAVSIPPYALLPAFFGVLHLNAFFYGGLASMCTAVRIAHERAALDMRAALLERELAATRFDALVASLDPDLLRGALAAVRESMRVDLRRTETLIQRLGELLRDTLAMNTTTWSLAEEREHVTRYTEVVSARRSAEIAVEWRLSPELSRREVPRFSVRELVSEIIAGEGAGVPVLRLCIEERPPDAAGAAALTVRSSGAKSALALHLHGPSP